MEALIFIEVGRPKDNIFAAYFQFHFFEMKINQWFDIIVSFETIDITIYYSREC